MNEDEFREKYQISQRVINEFNIWQLNQSDSRNIVYGDKDLPIIRLIAQLIIIGFNHIEIAEYLNFNQKNEKLKLLNGKRTERLNTVHNFENQIATIDYLKYQISEGDL